MCAACLHVCLFRSRGHCLFDLMLMPRRWCCCCCCLWLSNEIWNTHTQTHIQAHIFTHISYGGCVLRNVTCVARCVVRFPTDLWQILMDGMMMMMMMMIESFHRKNVRACVRLPFRQTQTPKWNNYGSHMRRQRKIKAGSNCTGKCCVCLCVFILRERFGVCDYLRADINSSRTRSICSGCMYKSSAIKYTQPIPCCDYVGIRNICNACGFR